MHAGKDSLSDPKHGSVEYKVQFLPVTITLFEDNPTVQL